MKNTYFYHGLLALVSAHLSDDEFLEAFHSCRLKNSEFRHGDRLRLTWLHLRREGLDAALDSVRIGIPRFAARSKFFSFRRIARPTLTQ